MPIVVVADDNDNNGHIKREPGVVDVDDARRCGVVVAQNKRTVDTKVNKQKGVSHAHVFLDLKLFSFFSKACEHM